MIKNLHKKDLILENFSRVNIFTGQDLAFSQHLGGLILQESNKHNISNNVKIIINPENNKSPSEQVSYINKLLLDSQKNNQIQHFIATNSPFIINEIAIFTEKAKIECDCNKTEFNPLARVYYLPNNKIATKKGSYLTDQLGQTKGRGGYWGKKASLIASNLFSNGLNNVKNKTKTTVESWQIPILVICEGQSSHADCTIYGKIFENWNSHQVMFVSSRGSSQAIVSFEIIKQMLSGIEADLNIYMLRDRDHEFTTDLSIAKYKANFVGRKVLSLRALECYLYNVETAKLLLKSLNLPVNLDSQAKLEMVQNRIDKQVEEGVMGDSYKDELLFAFNKCIKSYIKKLGITDFKGLKLTIAGLITPNTQTYKQLEKDIFL